MKKLYFLALAALLLAACKTETKVPVLTIEGGQVQGVTTDIPGVVAYKGIPYAAPPIGELRWKEPQPVVPWDGVMQADRFGHPGYQAVHYPGVRPSRLPGRPLSRRLFHRVGLWRGGPVQ